MILIVGATGRVGREVAVQLSARRVPACALVRNPDNANLPSGIDIVPGDLTAPPTFPRTDAVFLVWTAPFSAFPTFLNAIAPTTDHIVFLSAPYNTPHPFFQQPNPLRAGGLDIESRIEASGLNWTFLRPSMFSANALHFWGPQIRSGQTVRWPYLSTPTAPIDQYDMAAVAVQALCERGHDRTDYVITGPQSLTQAEQIDTIGRVIGREITKQNLSDEEARRELEPTYGKAIDMLLDAWRAGADKPAWVTNTVEQVTGNRARTFEQWVRKHAEAFR